MVRKQDLFTVYLDGDADMSTLKEVPADAVFVVIFNIPDFSPLIAGVSGYNVAISSKTASN